MGAKPSDVIQKGQTWRNKKRPEITYKVDRLSPSGATVFFAYDKTNPYSMTTRVFLRDFEIAVVKDFADADRFVEKLLTGAEDEFRVPLAEARKMGGLLKDLLAEVRK